MELAARKRAARRALAAERRRRLGETDAEGLAQQASLHLLDSGWLRSGGGVGLYAALPDELPTRPLFELLRARGHRTLFPRVLPGRRLLFLEGESWDELVPGRYGVREPGPSGTPGVLGADDLVVVPGVAFGPAGERLGRGGGYYDRSFQARPSPRLVGWAAAFQLQQSLPAGPRDRPVDAVVTELGIVLFQGDGGAERAKDAKGRP